MADPFTPNDDDLRLLTEHLCYELQMVFDLAVAVMSPATRRYPHFARMAMIEAFPMHVRQLTDFFWRERSTNPKVAKDAFAADYFARDEWAELRPERPTLLKETSSKVGRDVVHLTYSRARVTPEEKLWDTISICDSLLPVVQCFVENVDQKKLNADWSAEIRECLGRYDTFRRGRP